MDRSELRLQILLALKVQQAYDANQETLLKHLSQRGFAITRNQLHIELSWLESQADALVARDVQGFWSANLSGTGLEIAEGLITIPGIRKLRPDEINNAR